MKKLCLAEKIYKLRKACNLTQAQLAHKMGIWQDHISDYERDVRKISLRNLINMTQQCGILMSDFLNENFDNCNINNNFQNIKKSDKINRILLGHSIKKEREMKKISINQLAEQVGISEKRIISFEEGTTVPDIEMFLTICRILNSDIDKILQAYIKGINLEILKEIIIKNF